MKAIPAQQRVYTRNRPVPATPLTERILRDPPLPLLLRLAGPNAVAFFVQAAVAMAETAFVARLGAESLAGLGVIFPALMLMQMLANGAVGGAVSSAVARALGAGDRVGAEALVWHAVVMAVAAGFGFFVLHALLGSSLLAAVSASVGVARAAQAYAAILFAGAAFVWLAALCSAVFRGMGDMRLPAALMVVGGLVQVPLAGTLILGWFGVPRLGLQGAALAAVAVAVVNSAILLLRLARRRSPVRLTRARLRRAVFADVLKVGAPASLSPILTVATVTVMNGLVGSFGVPALAGYGIVTRLEFLLIPLVFGVGAAMTAMVGINVGAGQTARAERIAWLGGALAAALTGAVGLILAAVPGLWLELFTRDQATWDAGAAYLRVVGPFFAFQGLGLSLYFASQGAGTVGWPVAATALRFVLGVGGAAIGVHVLGQGLGFLYAALAAGTLVYGVVTAGSVGLGAWRRQSMIQSDTS